VRWLADQDHRADGVERPSRGAKIFGPSWPCTASDWDDSELLQGKRKVNGVFKCRKPKVVSVRLPGAPEGREPTPSRRDCGTSIVLGR
jgi:hypothetical protein